MSKASIGGRRLTPTMLAILGFLATVGPLSMDMYLSSFTDIAADLGASASSVQLTLTTFMVGMGLGQLLLGSASDIFGRKRVLVTALGVFVLSSVLLVFTPSIEVFIGLRIIQGLSGSAGVVLARAISVDLSDGVGAVKALSLITMMIGVGPLIAPPIGAFVHGFLGWRGVLATLAILAVAMLLLATFFVPESLPTTQRQPANFRAIFTRFGIFLRDPKFLSAVGAFVCAYGALAGYISASPFVGQTILNMGSVMYSFGFAMGASAIIIANIINARVAATVGPKRMLFVGILLGILAAVALLIQVVTDTLTAPGFIFSVFIMSGGVGLTMSNSNALALQDAGEARGSGAALLGALQFMAGGITSPLVGLAGEHTALPMAIVLVVCMALSLGCGLIALRTR